MKTSRFLLPRGFKTTGLIILTIAIVLVITYAVTPDGQLAKSWNDFRVLFGMEKIVCTKTILSSFNADSNLINTFVALLLVIAGVFIGFSRNREDDEYIELMRFESLILSIYLNSVAVLVCLILVWGLSFLYVMLISLFSVLYLFITLFYIRVLINRRALRNEE